MSVIGRLKNEDLLISGEINERKPIITDGLVAYFPFDGTEKGINNNLLYDYKIWEDGQTGAIGPFGLYSGGSTGNRRKIATNPWDYLDVVWESGGTASAGIYNTAIPIDNTKLYRMSWWEKRVTNGTATTARYYAGLQGYGSTAGVCNLSNGAYNTNPYFYNTSTIPTSSQLPAGEWVLVVGHIYPHTHTGTTMHPDSGRYTLNGKLGNNNADYKWGSVTATARPRTLTIYQGNTLDVVHHTIYPRMDICDGSEPTIEDLLMGVNGDGNCMNPIINSSTTLTYDGISIEEATTNLIPNSHLNSYPTYGNAHGTYNTNQYNNNAFFSIGTVGSVSNNIVTLSSVGKEIYTYDVLRPQTTGGGVTSGVNYFIKKHSSNSFSLHAYDSSQDGSKGYSVHDSIKNDVRVSINSTNFPTMWWGAPHLPNSALVKEIIPYGFMGIHDCIRCHGEHKPEGEQDYMAYSVNPTVTSGVTYTFSFWCRAVSARTIGTTMGFSLHTSGWWSLTRIEGNNVFNDYEWRKLSYRGVAPNTGGTSLYFLPFAKCGTIDIAGIQCEAKPFSTSLAINSRNTYGTLAFNAKQIINPLQGSICMDITDPPDNGLIRSIIFIGDYSSLTASRTQVYKSGDSIMVWVNNAFNSHTTTWSGFKRFVFTWNSSQLKLYMDGNLIVTRNHGILYGNLELFSIGCRYVSGWDSWIGNLTVKNLMVYNRILTDSEILKLSNTSLSLRANGDVYNQLDEESMTNLNSTYFPLSADGMDKYKLISPTTETNVEYEDGGAWVGNATTNMMNSNQSNLIGATMHSASQISTRDSSVALYSPDSLKIISTGSDGSNRGAYCHVSGLTVGATYTYSIYIYPVNIVTYGYFGPSTFSWTPTQNMLNRWNRVSRQFVAGSATSQLIYYALTTNSTAIFYLTNAQISLTSFEVPFVDGTRGHSNLYLPYNIIDCKQNFTIYGWWYPKTYADGAYRPCLTRNRLTSNVTHRRILIMGDVSSRRLRGWFGSGGSGEVSALYAPSSIAVKDNEWNFFALRRNGSTMSLFLGNSNGFGYGTDNNGNNLNTEEDSSTWGWLIGKYDSDSHLSNAYHRDYNFVQSALSDAEIELIFRRKLSFKNNKVNLQGQLIEGVSL